MYCLTEAELTKAIERTLVSAGTIPLAQAGPMARTVLAYFGFESAVLDNKLVSEDRDHFYRLEEVGLLKSEEEDAIISHGKAWRIHYWLLNKEKIRELGDPPQDHPKDSEDVYESSDTSMWSRTG